MVTKRLTSIRQQGGIEFTAAFDGPAVGQGRINARHLAPTLFALAGLVDVSAEELYGRGDAVTVDVKANFKQGSFEFELAVVTVVGTHLLQNLSVSDIHVMMSAIGFAGNNPNSLFGVLSRIGARRVERVETSGGNQVQAIVHGDNAQVTIINLQPEVARLLESDAVRKTVADIVAPVTASGIESLRIGSRAHPRVLITKEDVPKYLPPPPKEENLTDSVAETALELLSPNFVEGNKWKVAQGGEPFWVSMLDPEFLASVESGNRQFSKGDYLIVLLRTRAFATADGLSAEREVVRVLDHRHRVRQGGLFDKQ